MSDWVVTLPQKVEWSDYERELEAVRDRSGVLNYRLMLLPLRVNAGDRCFIIWRGRVRGWMEISGVARWPEGFTCQTTGLFWPPGHYLQRSGPFHPVDGPEMRGFRGIRRFDDQIYVGLDKKTGLV